MVREQNFYIIYEALSIYSSNSSKSLKMLEEICKINIIGFFHTMIQIAFEIKSKNNESEQKKGKIKTIFHVLNKKASLILAGKQRQNSNLLCKIWKQLIVSAVLSIFSYNQLSSLTPFLSEYMSKMQNQAIQQVFNIQKLQQIQYQNSLLILAKSLFKSLLKNEIKIKIGNCFIKIIQKNFAFGLSQLLNSLERLENIEDAIFIVNQKVDIWRICICHVSHLMKICQDFKRNQQYQVQFPLFEKLMCIMRDLMMINQILQLDAKQDAQQRDSQQPKYKILVQSDYYKIEASVNHLKLSVLKLISVFIQSVFKNQTKQQIFFAQKLEKQIKGMIIDFGMLNKILSDMVCFSLYFNPQEIYKKGTAQIQLIKEFYLFLTNCLQNIELKNLVLKEINLLFGNHMKQLLFSISIGNKVLLDQELYENENEQFLKTGLISYSPPASNIVVTTFLLQLLPNLNEHKEFLLDFYLDVVVILTSKESINLKNIKINSYFSKLMIDLHDDNDFLQLSLYLIWKLSSKKEIYMSCLQKICGFYIKMCMEELSPNQQFYLMNILLNISQDFISENIELVQRFINKTMKQLSRNPQVPKFKIDFAQLIIIQLCKIHERNTLNDKILEVIEKIFNRLLSYSFISSQQWVFETFINLLKNNCFKSSMGKAKINLVMYNHCLILMKRFYEQENKQNTKNRKEQYFAHQKNDNKMHADKQQIISQILSLILFSLENLYQEYLNQPLKELTQALQQIQETLPCLFYFLGQKFNLFEDEQNNKILSIIQMLTKNSAHTQSYLVLTDQHKFAYKIFGNHEQILNSMINYLFKTASYGQNDKASLTVNSLYLRCIINISKILGNKMSLEYNICLQKVISQWMDKQNGTLKQKLGQFKYEINYNQQRAYKQRNSVYDNVFKFYHQHYQHKTDHKDCNNYVLASLTNQIQPKNNNKNIPISSKIFAQVCQFNQQIMVQFFMFIILNSRNLSHLFSLPSQKIIKQINNFGDRLTLQDISIIIFSIYKNRNYLFQNTLINEQLQLWYILAKNLCSKQLKSKSISKQLLQVFNPFQICQQNILYLLNQFKHQNKSKNCSQMNYCNQMRDENQLFGTNKNQYQQQFLIYEINLILNEISNFIIINGDKRRIVKIIDQRYKQNSFYQSNQAFHCQNQFII